MGLRETVMYVDAVGVILGVAARTVSSYLTMSRAKDGRYRDHPFPMPDGYDGSRPYWRVTREQEILDWAKARVGQGVGGGIKV